MALQAIYNLEKKKIWADKTKKNEKWKLHFAKLFFKRQCYCQRTYYNKVVWNGLKAYLVIKTVIYKTTVLANRGGGFSLRDGKKKGIYKCPSCKQGWGQNKLYGARVAKVVCLV